MVGGLQLVKDNLSVDFLPDRFICEIFLFDQPRNFELKYLYQNFSWFSWLLGCFLQCFFWYSCSFLNEKETWWKVDCIAHWMQIADCNVLENLKYLLKLDFFLPLNPIVCSSFWESLGVVSVSWSKFILSQSVVWHSDASVPIINKAKWYLESTLKWCRKRFIMLN